MDEQTLAKISRFAGERYFGSAAVASVDVLKLVVEVRRLQAAWLVEKSRADRADGELSVLRPAVERAQRLANLWDLLSDPYSGRHAEQLRAALAGREGATPS